MRAMAKTLLIFAIVVAITAVGLYLAHQRAQRLTNETDAVVSRVEVRQLAPRDNGRFETDVFYRFTVNGQTFEARSTKLGRRDSAFPIGTPGRVRYNPDRPSEADVISGGD
jgi:hypothetical protein